VIDRTQLRCGLRDLATGQYRVLVISGATGSGKSHSWRLLDHLHITGTLSGIHSFVRVTTQEWSYKVTGEEVALTLADRLGLRIDLMPSGELEEARIRKILSRIVGGYPKNDGITRWIVLDGLDDRRRAENSARDVGKQLITMVAGNQLPQTRLVVTGFDILDIPDLKDALLEEIPVIDDRQVSAFLRDVAAHIGHKVSDQELETCVDGVLGAGGNTDRLSRMEDAVLRLAREWAEEVRDDD